MDINGQSYQLAQYYYQYAQSHTQLCQSALNLKEYFTLVKLSLSLLFKITSSNQKTSLTLKLKSYLLISRIIQNESLDDTYQEYLDQILVLTQNSLSDPLHLFFNLQAKFLLCKSYQITPSNYKQTLNIVNSHEQILLFKYLKFEILGKVSKDQALYYLQNTLIPSLPLDPKFKKLSDYIKLLEFLHSLQNNLPVSTDIGSILPDDLQLISMKHVFECLYYLQYNPEFINEKSSGLEEKLRGLASFLTNNEEELTEGSIELRFPFLQDQDFVITVEWLSYNDLNIMFSFLYGLTVLNKSFEKRKSKGLFGNAKRLIDHELGKFNQFNSKIKSLTPRYKQLREWRESCEFYTLLEEIITEDLTLEQFTNSSFKVSDPSLLLYVTAFYHQSNADLEKAVSHYDIILNHYNKPGNEELVLYSLFNYYFVVDGKLSLLKRSNTTHSPDLVELSSKKNKILEEIHNMTQNNNKFMVNLTKELIYLIDNPTNLSILELNSKVSQILRTNEEIPKGGISTFEKYKKTPQLLAILLYLNSLTLNSNSDERQKTSQVAFNLAKYGNFKFLRYITGVLNLKNAQFANNFDQVRIQTAKLDKICLKLEVRKNDFTSLMEA